MVFDWTALLGPGLIAAIISAIVAGTGIWISARTARKIHEEKIIFDSRLAKEKAQYDRALKDWERRGIFAEDLLAACYQARELMVKDLQVAIFFAALTEASGDPEAERRQRLTDACNSIIASFAAYSEMISSLAARRYRAQAYYGTETADAITNIASVYHGILLSAKLLRERLNGALQGTWSEDETKIGLGPQAIAPVTTELEKAIAVVESTCREAMDVKIMTKSHAPNAE